MKKLLFLGYLINVFVVCFGQDHVAEYEYLESEYNKGKIDQKTYLDKKNTLSALISEYGDYPDIPFDSVKNDYRYEFVIELPGLTKNIIYNRILEFMSLRYNYLDEVLDYQDFDLGKIIIKERYPLGIGVGDGKVYYLATERFIIVDNRMKLEISNLSVDFYYDKKKKDDVVMYNYNMNYPIDTFFPITQFEENLINDYFLLVSKIKENLFDVNEKIPEFIKSYKEDYNF